MTAPLRSLHTGRRFARCAITGLVLIMSVPAAAGDDEHLHALERGKAAFRCSALAFSMHDDSAEGNRLFAYGYTQTAKIMEIVSADSFGPLQEFIESAGGSFNDFYVGLVFGRTAEKVRHEIFSSDQHFTDASRSAFEQENCRFVGRP